MNSKRILFLCGHYAFPSAANSICVQNLAEEAVKQGIESFVLARGYEYRGTCEVINGVKVWKCYGDTYGRVVDYFETKKGVFFKLLFKLIQSIHYIVVFWSYPITSFFDLYSIKLRAKKLVKQYDIGTVVATYGPYETIKVAMCLKSSYKNSIRAVSYHLDLLTNPSNSSSIVSKLKQYKASLVLKKEFELMDRVILPSTAPIINNSKIKYVDFPLYITKPLTSFTGSKTFFNPGCINIAIAGSLDTSNRNPLIFCNIIEGLTVNNKQVILHIWGRIVGLDLSGFSNVIYHGMANVEDVPIILQQSDFLFNVGNKNSFRMLPSKIFQMFAAKKPIIFLCLNTQDRSIPYFDKYGYTCFIPGFEGGAKDYKEMVKNFIVAHYGKPIDVDDSVFKESTPSFILNSIMEP